MSTSSFETEVLAEVEKAKDMSISDLKLKLQAKGVLTASFCEKSELIRAYAEMKVKEPRLSVGMREDMRNGEDVSGIGLNMEQMNVEDDGSDGDSGTEEVLPLYMQHRVDKLTTLHTQRENIVKEYLQDRAKLEAKYQSLFEPLFVQRARVLAGECDNDIRSEHAKEGVVDPSSTDAEETGVPMFWLRALNSLESTAELIAENDIPCLERLVDIRCADDVDGKGFTLKFRFEANDFFENDTLTKRYSIPNLLLDDEPLLQNVEGCEIHWKAGKDLASVETTKQQKGTGKNAGKIRSVTKREKSESFFHFFAAPALPSLSTSMNEEDIAELELAFNQDYDVAQAIRSQIIPKAIMWFTGKAMEQEMQAAMEGMNWPEGVNHDGGE